MTAAKAGCSRPGLPPEDLVPVERQEFGLGAGGLRRSGQWLAFIGLEVLGYGLASEMVAKRRGADRSWLCIEGD